MIGSIILKYILISILISLIFGMTVLSEKVTYWLRKNFSKVKANVVT